jgi:hypothetical protein
MSAADKPVTEKSKSLPDARATPKQMGMSDMYISRGNDCPCIVHTATVNTGMQAFTT